MTPNYQALKDYFYRNNIRQVDIVERTGIDKATVSNFLAGRRPLGRENARRLADAFGLSLAFILTGEGDMFPAGRQEVGNGAIVNGGKVEGGINVTATNAALEAENQRLREEVKWLRSMLENASRVQASSPTSVTR